MATLREHLARPGSFVVATEIVTSRGLVTPNGSGGGVQRTSPGDGCTRVVTVRGPY